MARRNSQRGPAICPCADAGEFLRNSQYGRGIDRAWTTELRGRTRHLRRCRFRRKLPTATTRRYGANSGHVRAMLAGMSDVTRMLLAIEQGDQQASADLLPLVYQELRKLAAVELQREPAGHTLQPTALVHEAYLRLVGEDDEPHWNHRGHFYVAAAEAMRRILVESARRKRRLRHGGEHQRVGLDIDALATPQRHPDLLALDEVLEKLHEARPRIGQLVSLRYFAGLTMEQAAQALGVPLRTAEREWAYARAWLLAELRQV